MCLTLYCSSDTATRSGMYCSVATTIDRCKTEGVVDVFQVVKALRVHKPGAVPSVVSSSAARAIIDPVYHLITSQTSQLAVERAIIASCIAIAVHYLYFLPHTTVIVCVQCMGINVPLPLTEQLQGCFRGLVGLLGLL